MCERKSMLCIRGEQEPFWDLGSDSHESLVNLRGLKDDKLYDRNFVRVEVKPTTDDQFSQNPDDWMFNIDESATLPSWFENDKQLWADRCIHMLTKIIINKERAVGRVGNLTLKKGEHKYPWLKSVGGDLSVDGSAKLDAPKLKTVGGKPFKM